MHHRALGRTGWEVSEVGFGCWGIGGTMWLGAEDQESITAMERAIELGMTFFDTALVYGEKGHSEKLVGEVVRRHGDKELRVATKVPPKNREWPARRGVPVEETFPGEWVRRCAERSLKNLGMDTVDLLQLHVWDDGWVGQGDWLETVEALRDEGAIRAFGVSINDHQPDNGLALVRSGAVDAVQVIFNVFDQSPADELLAACAEHGVGVLARVPFDEGGLTGRITPETTFPEGDFRNWYFRDDRKQQVLDRCKAITEDLGITMEDLPEVALRFILSHPEVSTVIPGMRTLRNVERNCAVGDGRGLPAEQVERLRAHRWERNFYR
jgi:aryl-alcohol dehydrogenase-like predicted oxidoreductase